jgi:hypothetical protein
MGKFGYDFGIGYADLSMRAMLDGAHVVGVDKDSQNAAQRIIETGFFHECNIFQMSLEHMMTLDLGKRDFAFLMSVLPYVADPDGLMVYIADRVETLFVELQYPPEPYVVKGLSNDIAMGEWLSLYWKSVQDIGRTEIKIRDTFRTIWMCQNELSTG